MEENLKRKPQVIFFEGGEGAGKTTLIQSLSVVLTEAGIAHITTREPGGSPGAEQIRRLIKEGPAERFVPETHLLLHYAARFDHLARIVIPVLEHGEWVLCDRFEVSSYAYQVAAMGCSALLFEQLHQEVVAKLSDVDADFTYVHCDVDPKIGLARVRHQLQLAGEGRLADDAYDGLGLAFHEQVRAGMREAQAHIDLLFTHHTIDANQSSEVMLAAARKVLGI